MVQAMRTFFVFKFFSAARQAAARKAASPAQENGMPPHARGVPFILNEARERARFSRYRPECNPPVGRRLTSA